MGATSPQDAIVMALLTALVLLAAWMTTERR
jgi:hypothetical protein